MQERFLENHVTHFGLHENLKPAADMYVAVLGLKLQRSKFASLNPARLSYAERAQLDEAATNINSYFHDKFNRLGLPTETNPLTEEIVIVEENTVKGREIAGSHNGSLGITIAGIRRNRTDLLDTANTMAHEQSHATTRHEIRVQWSSESDSLAPHSFANFVGFSNRKKVSASRTIPKADITSSDVIQEQRTSQEITFSDALENGLALMDELDIYNQKLRDLFPKDSNERQKWLNRPLVEGILEFLDNSMYGPISKSSIEPFVALEYKKLPLIRKPILPGLFINQVQIMNLRFTEELCKTLGYVTSNGELTDEELIQVGRDLLEVDRYTPSREGLKTLVHVFGKERAKVILRAEVNPDMLDDAMIAVRQTQAEMEIYKA